MDGREHGGGRDREKPQAEADSRARVRKFDARVHRENQNLLYR